MFKIALVSFALVAMSAGDLQYQAGHLVDPGFYRPPTGPVHDLHHHDVHGHHDDHHHHDVHHYDDHHHDVHQHPKVFIPPPSHLPVHHHDDHHHHHDDHHHDVHHDVHHGHVDPHHHHEEPHHHHPPSQGGLLSKLHHAWHDLTGTMHQHH
ncbi:histidine-rich glycoprotein-like [Trichogramma pretiosum]|uniref:histidine-rich glycoprotein-like n=1 Tax=Trichogramma pretiosum TaxID=7493 RepID=UPI0006C9986B|nr:histidine-rich glycoprotein-like [Trichogramma pretiosum]